MTGKRIYRSVKERKIGGVCGGLGEFLDVDPTIIRLLWAIMTIISFGVGIIAYLVAWIIIPERQESSPKKAKKKGKK